MEAGTLVVVVTPRRRVVLVVLPGRAVGAVVVAVPGADQVEGLTSSTAVSGDEDRSRPLALGSVFPSLRSGGSSKSPGGVPDVAARMYFCQIWAGIPPPLTARPRTRFIGLPPSSAQPTHTAVVRRGLAV